MKLLIKPLNDIAMKYYLNHGHFHKGDAGLDLYVLQDDTFKAGETKKIKLGISCENQDWTGYFLFPRSSISKTPLRMANSIGLIDAGYRGEIMAVCDNIKDYDFTPGGSSLGSVTFGLLKEGEKYILSKNNINFDDHDSIKFIKFNNSFDDSSITEVRLHLHDNIDLSKFKILDNHNNECFLIQKQ